MIEWVAWLFISLLFASSVIFYLAYQQAKWKENFWRDSFKKECEAHLKMRKKAIEAILHHTSISDSGLLKESPKDQEIQK